MKTSIFDMNFTLPPMLEITEVEKDMPRGTSTLTCRCGFFPAPYDMPLC